jgi:hypothetical protein
MTRTKKYICIVKVGSEKFVRYHVNDLLSFTKFLDKEFTDWRWFNVFSNDKNSEEKQLSSFTKNNRPVKQFIDDG